MPILTCLQNAQHFKMLLGYAMPENCLQPTFPNALVLSIKIVFLLDISSNVKRSIV